MGWLVVIIALMLLSQDLITILLGIIPFLMAPKGVVSH